MAAPEPSRIEAADPPPLLDRAQCWWLIAAAVVALLPLVQYQPPWLAAGAAAALGLRAWLLATHRPLPNRWVLAFAALAASVGVYLEYRTLFGQNPGVALLAMFLALKQLESRAPRDGLASIFLCYFLVLTGFFYSQAIANGLMLFAAVLATTAALASLTDSRPAPAAQLRKSGWMLAQSLPFLLLLFVLFPRISGPLWGLPRDAFSGQTGLSDSMSPGAISNLSQSDAIAFRARFIDAVPPRDQLYWRGPVLTVFDGLTWRMVRHGLITGLSTTSDTSGVRHEVTLEPHNKPWLFALELPVRRPIDSVMTRDFQMLATAPVNERRRYEVTSVPRYSVGVQESPRVLALASHLPPGRNPRTLALAREWRAASSDDAAILRTALAFFVGQRLIYTLSPPLTGTHGVDDFLFETRQGFCEHFAGAFVFAMRAAGVPARVVLGYQGGEINPVDGFMTVRQSDAHAWAEVWLEGRGWTRVDPTAASHPTRIDRNLAAAVPAGDPLPLLMRANLAWLRDLRYRWDAVANGWNQWIVGYNPQRQMEFLARLGLDSADWRQMASLLSALGGAALAALAWAVLRQRRSVDPAQALWLKATAKLARRGLPPLPWEGPRDYARRIATARPAIAQEIDAISSLYAGARYGKVRDLQALRTRVAAFKP